MTSPLNARFSPYLQRFDGLLAAQTTEIRRIQGQFCPPAGPPGESGPCRAEVPSEGGSASIHQSTNPSIHPCAPSTNPPIPPSPPSSALSTISTFLQSLTLAFLPAIQPTAESLHLIDRLLKRVLDLEKLLHRRHNPASQPAAEPEPAPAPRPSPLTGIIPGPDDIVDEHGITNAEKIALMHKAYFADVDEFIASGQLEKMMPPPYDPCEIKADKEKNRPIHSNKSNP